MEEQIEHKINIESEVEVLISGAGPVGLIMANLLHKCNISFKIIERRTNRLRYSRAFVIHSRTQEIFEQIGIMHKIKELAKISAFGGYLYKDGQLIYTFKLPNTDSPHPNVVALLQSEIERILDEKLVEEGHYIDYGIELIDLEIDETTKKFSSAIVNHLDSGKKERVKFKYLVGCDGARSLVRKLANIRFIGKISDLQITFVDTIVETELNKDLLLNLLTDGIEVIGMFWINSTHARFALRKDTEERNHKEYIELIKRFSSNKIKIKKILWVNTFTIKEFVCESNHNNNLFLCGDAAHIHSPAGGQGMNTGIQDAYNLAWKLSLIIKGIGNEDILKYNFNEERSMVAEMVLKSSGFAIRSIFGKPNFIATFLKRTLVPFALSFKSVKDTAISSLSGIGIEYNDSKLIKKYTYGWIYNTKVPGVGLRAPDNELINIINNDLTSVHTVLSGKDQFELFIHLPGNILNYNKFDKLNNFIKQLYNNEDFINIQSKLNNGLFNICFIINQSTFNIKQWGYYIQINLPNVNIKDIIKIQDTFKLNNSYLDVKGWGTNDYSFSIKEPTFFVVRPDAYIALNQSSLSLSPIINYFDAFIV